VSTIHELRVWTKSIPQQNFPHSFSPVSILLTQLYTYDFMHTTNRDLNRILLEVTITGKLVVAVGPQYLIAAKSYALAAFSSLSYPPNNSYNFTNTTIYHLLYSIKFKISWEMTKDKNFLPKYTVGTVKGRATQWWSARCHHIPCKETAMKKPWKIKFNLTEWSKYSGKNYFS